MANEFSIAVESSRFISDGPQRGAVSAVVTNTTDRRLQARAQLEALGSARTEWFTIEGAATRWLKAAEAAQYSIKAAPPPGTPAGDYTVRLNMVGIADPDEEFSDGPALIFTLKQPVPATRPKQSFPWWIVILALGLLLVSGVLLGVRQWQGACDEAATTAAEATRTAAAQATRIAEAQATKTALEAQATRTTEAEATRIAAAQATQTAAAEATKTAAAEATKTAAVEATWTATAESTRTAEAAAAAQATATVVAKATADAQAAASATATAIAVATVTACADQVVDHVEGNGAFIEFELRAGSTGTVRSWSDGYHTQYQFPTCRGIGWSNATFTCDNGTWVGNPQYYNNALCTGSSNDSQRGITLGVR